MVPSQQGSGVGEGSDSQRAVEGCGAVLLRLLIPPGTFEKKIRSCHLTKTCEITDSSEGVHKRLSSLIQRL